MAIFKKGRGPYALHISMTGVQMGERLLQIGAGDGRLFAALAGRVGLTGRACVVDRDESAIARAKNAAANAGVLIEPDVVSLRNLPYEDAAFDLIVIGDLLSTMKPDERVGSLQEAWRVARPGGRCIVIERAERGGLGALFARRGKDPDYLSSGGAERALREEGFRAVRTLAAREGVAFIEGVKPRT